MCADRNARATEPYGGTRGTHVSAVYANTCVCVAMFTDGNVAPANCRARAVNVRLVARFRRFSTLFVGNKHARKHKADFIIRISLAAVRHVPVVFMVAFKRRRRRRRTLPREPLLRVVSRHTYVRGRPKTTAPRQPAPPVVTLLCTRNTIFPVRRTRPSARLAVYVVLSCRSKYGGNNYGLVRKRSLRVDKNN